MEFKTNSPKNKGESIVGGSLKLIKGNGMLGCGGGLICGKDHFSSDDVRE